MSNWHGKLIFEDFEALINCSKNSSGMWEGCGYVSSSFEIKVERYEHYSTNIGLIYITNSGGNYFEFTIVGEPIFDNATKGQEYTTTIKVEV